MKVRIEDKEAIEALSWESLKTYLDRSKDWRYAEDISDKAAVYQHTDKTGRLREVIVPLRRDLGDYVSRMADAVSTLARVEDRSELDVYDDLSTSPAETARKAHTQIRGWLAESGWKAEDTAEPGATLNLTVTLGNGQAVTIMQDGIQIDHVTVAKEIIFGDEFLSAYAELSDTVKRDIWWGIHRDLLIMGLEFDGPGDPPKKMQFYVPVYLDGLTKDLLMQRILLVHRAVSLAVWSLDRGFQEVGRSAEAAANLWRLVPAGSKSLTLAS
jgi:hypothetical protein